MIALKAESRNRGGRRIRADAIRSHQEAVTEPTCLAHALAAHGRKRTSSRRFRVEAESLRFITDGVFLILGGVIDSALPVYFSLLGQAPSKASLAVLKLPYLQLNVRVLRASTFVLRRKAWAVFVSRSVFVSRMTRRPDRASARIRRGGRGDSLCDGAAETRRLTVRRAAPRRTRFREENHGKDASATAAGGSERPIPASVKKVLGRFRDA